MDIDAQILKLIGILKSNGTIRFDKEFCDTADILHSNLIKVRKGGSRFTVHHIENIIKEYNVNPNWIFGIEDNVFKSLNKKEPII